MWINWILRRAKTQVICDTSILRQDKFTYQIPSQYFTKWKRKVRKTNIQAKGNNSCKSRSTQQNSNLICITWRQIHIQNFKWISQKTAEKSPETQILANGNNSYKNVSGATKLEFVLYHVKANSYTKFKGNISKDCRENSGKLHFSKGQ